MDLSPYTGQRARLRDPKQAAVLLENSTYSMRIYRKGTVDHEFFNQAVVLTEDTADALYGDFTPLDQPYTPGTRVFLEKVVAAVTDGLSGDREKAIAINDWVRDIPRTYANQGEPFHGGAEEEVIRKGSNMCNEMSRVSIILAQVAGIRSRYVGHMIMFDYDDPTTGSGHGVTELYVDGAWAYFDIRGKYFEKPDGTLASTWDLLGEPSLLESQSDEVLSHIGASSSQEVSKLWFAPKPERPAVTVMLNYLAADHASYDYSWVYPSPGVWQEAREAARAIRVTEHAAILPQPQKRVV